MAYLSGIEITIDIDFKEVEIPEAKAYVSNTVKQYSDLIFNQNTMIQVDLEEGSLKINLAVLGVLYLAIGQYGSFRSGIDYLIKDAKSLKDIVVSQLVRQGVNESDVISAAKTHCTPDKIRRVMLAIERLESKTNIAPSELKKELSKIRTSVKNICRELNRQDIALFAASISAQYLPEDSEIPSIAAEHKLFAREEDIMFSPLLSFEQLQAKKDN